MGDNTDINSNNSENDSEIVDYFWKVSTLNSFNCSPQNLLGKRPPFHDREEIDTLRVKYTACLLSNLYQDKMMNTPCYSLLRSAFERNTSKLSPQLREQLSSCLKNNHASEIADMHKHTTQDNTSKVMRPFLHLTGIYSSSGHLNHAVDTKNDPEHVIINKVSHVQGSVCKELYANSLQCFAGVLEEHEDNNHSPSYEEMHRRCFREQEEANLCMYSSLCGTDIQKCLFKSKGNNATEDQYSQLLPECVISEIGNCRQKVDEARASISEMAKGVK